jgi:protein-L-isoaspartate(D-aspartate) O-methyltransferase
MSWVRQLFGPDRSRSDRDHLLDRLHRDPRVRTEVVDAISRVPRECFVPADLVGLAYEDAALRIGPEATISAPSMVAEMLSVLELRPGAAVLEVGLGSGYAAAVMAAMGARVIGVELDPALAEQARRNLDAAGLSENVEVVAADGRHGWPDRAPYDRVLASAAVEAVPQEWLGQLVDGGVLVYPEAGVDEDLLIRLTVSGEGVRREELGRCRFVRMQL